MEELYKIVIVDDEATISEGLSQLVKWNEEGYCVAGTFSDGQEAMEFLEENDAHVVLTDIKMPRMTGVELAAWIYENRPEIKVVFLTGFKEFDYVKQAMDYNVNYYLLKPTELSELYETFRKIKKVLDSENKHTRYMDNVKQMMHTQFLSNIFFGVVREPSEITRMAEVSGDINNLVNSYYAVILLEILQYEEYINTKSNYSTQQLYDIIYNWFVLNYQGVEFVPVYNNRQYITYIAYSKEPVGDIFTDTGFIKSEISKMFNLNINAEISNVYGNIFEFAKDCSSNNVSLRKGEGDRMDLARFFEKQKILAANIFFGDKDAAIAVFESIMWELDSFEFEIKKNYVEYIFTNIYKKIQGAETGIAFDIDISESEECDNELYVKGKKTISEMVENIKGGFEMSKDFVINKAKKYIKDNYSKDITLSEVANYVFLSAAYFSRLFKKHCDENFSDYLMRVRITKAMNLLENTSLKVYEIAEKVGFKTLKYFYRNFKEYTGWSPSEYRAIKKNPGSEE